MEIPIPTGPDGLLDFSVCQKAWWMAIDEIYRELEEGRVPVRVALEMRVMGGSNVLLACQRGNNATCAIQTFTNALVGEREWSSFIQRLSDRWATLEDPVTGQPLILRPHWAKDWPSSIRGLPVEEYLKKSYEQSSEEFRMQVTAIANDGKYSTEEALRMFGNDTLLNIIGLAA